jgi:hypothetical protein
MTTGFPNSTARFLVARRILESRSRSYGIRPAAAGDFLGFAAAAEKDKIGLTTWNDQRQRQVLPLVSASASDSDSDADMDSEADAKMSRPEVADDIFKKAN